MRILTLGGVDDSVLESLKQNRVDTELADESRGMDGLVEWFRGDYDVVLLSIGAKWGANVAQRMRTEGIATPIVGIVEEDSSNIDKATFLESGGDDVVRHPFEVRELLASLRAVSRRYKGSLSDIRFFTQGESMISFNAATGELKVNGKKVKLTFREKKLVDILSVRSPRIVSKETIQEYLYPYGEEPGIGSVEVFVTKIRSKLRKIHPDASDSIETIWGGGYRMVSE